jgi:hypothetical protein
MPEPAQTDQERFGVDLLSVQFREEIEQTDDMIVVDVAQDHPFDLAPGWNDFLLEHWPKMIVEDGGRPAIDQDEMPIRGCAVLKQKTIAEFGLNHVKGKHGD